MTIVTVMVEMITISSPTPTLTIAIFSTWPICFGTCRAKQRGKSCKTFKHSKNQQDQGLECSVGQVLEGPNFKDVEGLGLEFERKFCRVRDGGDVMWLLCRCPS